MAKIKHEFDGYRINILTKKGECQNAMLDSESATLWCVEECRHEWEIFNIEKVYRANMGGINGF